MGNWKASEKVETVPGGIVGFSVDVFLGASVDVNSMSM